MLRKAIELIAPWKKYLWIGLAIAILAAIAGGVYLVRDWKKSIEDASYKSGQVAEHDRQADLAKEIEKALAPKLDKIDQLTAERIAEQNNKETVYVDRIYKEIAADPHYAECRISDSMLNDRNEIRKSLAPSSDTGSGADAVAASNTPS